MSRKVTTQANLKCGDIERNHKAVRKKKGEHKHTHVPSELTSLPQSRQTCNRTENLPSEGSEESVRNKNTSICFVQKESELLRRVFRAIVSLTPCCRAPTSSITDDKCDMTALLGRLRRLQTEIYSQHSVQQGEVCQDKTIYLKLLMPVPVVVNMH